MYVLQFAHVVNLNNDPIPVVKHVAKDVRGTVRSICISCNATMMVDRVPKHPIRKSVKATDTTLFQQTHLANDLEDSLLLLEQPLYREAGRTVRSATL